MKKSRQADDLCVQADEVKRKIMCMRSYYNEITDDNLISACIYEINALQAQYSHIINEAKMRGIEGDIALYPARYESY